MQTMHLQHEARDDSIAVMVRGSSTAWLRQPRLGVRQRGLSKRVSARERVLGKALRKELSEMGS